MNKTTYVLGAGASKAAWGFPTLDEFLGNALGGRNGNRELRKYVEDRFGGPKRANLESVLADLDQTLYGLGANWEIGGADINQESAQTARTQLVRLIAEHLSKHKKILPDDRDGFAYRKVMGGFGAEDTIITFNYDRGIEFYAEHMGGESATDPSIKALATAVNIGREAACGYDSCWEAVEAEPGVPPRTNLLLKLHGSIDFLACTNTECLERTRIVKLKKAILPMQIAKPCPACGASLRQVIVPPQIPKTFTRWPSLAYLWRLALLALRESSRVVFWGYSCPLSDYHVAWLLRSSLRTRYREGRESLTIHVIDPNEHVEGNLKKIIDGDSDHHGRSSSVAIRRFDSHEDYEPDM